ncbi:MAG: Type secretory pathway component PulF-like protein [Pedosphaera sp.]|nr:Type secretory pathway component PulF-like protein [Pedosphaera sp.]
MNNSDDSLLILKLILAVVVWLLVWLGPIGGFLYAFYYCLTLPLRRQERARFFLDLVESGLKDGRPVEETIMRISESRDRSMGVRFHLLATYIESGCRLREALEKVPRFLPLQVTAMLKAGEKIGDLRKVLPACRQLLQDANSQLRSAVNYLVLLAFVFTPLGVAALAMLEIRVMPMFLSLTREMGVAQSAPLAFMLREKWLCVGVESALVLAVWSAAFFYVGGPRLTSWFNARFSPFVDDIHYAIPWRRKRMQRDFSAMLAILLDAGMPEAEALALAGDCTDNAVFQQRAAQAVAGLKQGMKLTEAVQAIDDTGEFHWRLTNACHAQGGFFKAMAGWNLALDAKAFQQEQATAQVVSTGMVVLNGVVVAVIAITVFQLLLSIINLAL